MVQFIYIGSHYDRGRELVVENVFNIVSEIISLPQNLEVEFIDLSPNIYGETLLDRRFKNRIRLHESLSSKEVVIPLIHELLHLNQSHTGKLIGLRNGAFIWDSKVYLPPENYTLEEWAKMPWEIDVCEKQEGILEQVLSLQNLTNKNPSDILEKWKQVFKT